MRLELGVIELLRSLYPRSVYEYGRKVPKNYAPTVTPSSCSNAITDFKGSDVAPSPSRSRHTAVERKSFVEKESRRRMCFRVDRGRNLRGKIASAFEIVMELTFALRCASIQLSGGAINLSHRLALICAVKKEA